MRFVQKLQQRLSPGFSAKWTGLSIGQTRFLVSISLLGLENTDSHTPPQACGKIKIIAGHEVQPLQL